MKAKINKNILNGVLGFVVPTLAMLFVTPVLINGLGQDAFGIFVLATSLGGSFSFLDLGFSSATTKYIAEAVSNQKFGEVGSIIKTSLVLYFFLAAVISSVIWFFAPYLPEIFSLAKSSISDAVLTFRLAAIQFCFLLLLSVYISVFKAFHRFDLATYLTSYAAVVGNAGAGLAVWLSNVGLVEVSVIGLFSSISALGLAHFILISICQQRDIDIKRTSASMVIFRKMIGFSAILTVHSLASIFFTQAQRLIIGVLLGPVAVTVYQVAYTAVSKCHSLINSAAEILFPIVSELQNRTLLLSLYKKALLISAVFSVCILSPLMLFANKIITLWVGKSIALSATPLLQILGVAFFFVAISAPSYHIMNGIGKPIVNVIYSTCNVLLYIFTLWIFSIRGELILIDFALSFMVSNVITGIIYQLFVMRLLGKYKRSNNIGLTH